MRDPDIISTSIETQEDILHRRIDISMLALVRFWIGVEYTEKTVAVATIVELDLWKDNTVFNEVVLRAALEKLAMSIKEENERLQNLHTPKPVRKVPSFKKEEGELGGYSSKVPDILWGAVDDYATRQYPTGIGSIAGSPTLYVTSAVDASYDDGGASTSTGQCSRIQL